MAIAVIERARKIRWLAPAVSIGLTWAASSAAWSDEASVLRVMTYNIRLDTAADGVNRWSNRRDLVTAQMEWLRPDLFGLQEVLPSQRVDIAAALPQYAIFGGGRDDGRKAGEASPIGFDRSRFRQLDGGNFWLSPSPDAPSKGWDAAFPRIVTWVRLRARRSPHKLLVVNTHWDHVGTMARLESARLMSRWLVRNQERCEQLVVLGDFNAPLDSDALRMLVDTVTQSGPLRDARMTARSPAFGPVGTFNEFKLLPDESPTIDHILVSSATRVERFAVFAQHVEGRLPSDHYPVIADIALERCR